VPNHRIAQGEASICKKIIRSQQYYERRPGHRQKPVVETQIAYKAEPFAFGVEATVLVQQAARAHGGDTGAKTQVTKLFALL
jgi:hypothetical protein